MSKSDEELMLDFQEGNESAFITLYERYKLPIYRFIYRKLGHQARAEDLTQEVFLALIQHHKEWRREASFKTYLYCIAFNRCASEARRSEYKVMVESDDEANTERAARVPSDGVSPAAAVEQQELQRQVQRALARLDPEQRDPIILREYEGLSYEEIAEILSIAVGTVKSRIFRGKLELKRLLTPVMSAGLNQVRNAGPPSPSSPSEISSPIA
ncbi:MAG: sigma-70 family RNA polymerase sigma factor [Acidobacteriota bacterium]